MNRWLVIAVALVALSVQAADADWIAASNRNSQILLDVTARYAPEYATLLGVEGYDDDVSDLKPRFLERQEADLEAAAKQLESIRATTTDPRVQQDLDILIDAARDRRTTSEINRKYMLPFYDVPQASSPAFRI